MILRGENMVDFSENRANLASSDLKDGISYEPISEEIANKILQELKEKDEDSSMRVSFDELSNAIVKEYVANIGNREMALQEDEAMNNLINYYRERAKEFDANGDGALNIDEYTQMFKAMFAKAEKEIKSSKSTLDKKVKLEEPIFESSAVKFEKAFETGKKSAEIVDNFVKE